MLRYKEFFCVFYVKWGTYGITLVTKNKPTKLFKQLTNDHGLISLTAAGKEKNKLACSGILTDNMAFDDVFEFIMNQINYYISRLVPKTSPPRNYDQIFNDSIFAILVEII